MGFHVITVRRWVYAGEIPSEVVGKRENRLSQTEVIRIMEERRGARIFLYSRVGPTEASHQLAQQAGVLREWVTQHRAGKQFEEISEVGDSLTLDRANFSRLLRFIESHKVSELVVLNRQAIIDHPDQEVSALVFSYFIRHVESFGGFVRVISEP